MQRTNFSSHGDHLCTSFVTANSMDPLFSLRSERRTISIPSGGIQEHKNQQAQQNETDQTFHEEDFSGETLSKQNTEASLASLSCNSSRVPTEWSTIFAFGVQRASFRSQGILNFRVMVVRDIKLRSHLSKNIYLSHDLYNFQKLEHQEKYLHVCKCLFVKYRQLVAQKANISSRCLYYFPAATLVPCWCTSDVHQHGVSILSSVNFYETFRRISAVWENAKT